MEWLRPKFVWALPARARRPLLSRRPGGVPHTAAPSCLLASWVLLFYLLLEENSLSLCVCCGSNKLPLFLPTLKRYKSNRVGRWLLPGKGATSLKHNTTVGRSNCIYAPGPTAVCASCDAHTLSDYKCTHKHAHTHARKSSRSAEVVKCTVLLHTSTFQVSHGRGTWRWPMLGSCRTS